MKTTDKFGLTIYDTADAKAIHNKELVDSLESNFNILDKSACKVLSIPLTAGEDNAYTTPVEWNVIKNAIDNNALIVVDLSGSFLSLMVCNKSNDNYSLLFGYTNIVNGTAVTRAVSCIYSADDGATVWTDADKELELGVKIPDFTEADEGKCLGIKNGQLVFAAVGDFNLY